MERTKYMQGLIVSSYQNVAIEAVRNGFDGSLERLIARQLEMDYLGDHSEACELVNFITESDQTMPIRAAALKAAYLITSSKIPENV